MKKNEKDVSVAEYATDTTPKYVIPKEKLASMGYNGEEAFPLGAVIYFCYSVFGVAATNRAFRGYKVMITKRYRKNGLFGVVYVYYDHKGRIRQIKEMGYDGKTGRRLKEGDPCDVYNGRNRYYEQRPDTNKVIQVGKWLVDGYESKPCFYGEHLLSEYPDKPVAIVESEKTAIICSICLPDYLWLATGGIYGCQWDSPEVYSILRDRKIVVFPDLNATATWHIKADIMRADGMDVSVYDLESMAFVSAEDKQAGLDIGDYMIKLWLQEHPDAGETAEIRQAPAAVVPEVTNALSKLSPVRPQAAEVSPKATSDSASEQTLLSLKTVAPALTPDPTATKQTPRTTVSNPSAGAGSQQSIEESYNIDLNKIAEFDTSKKKGKRPVQEPEEDLYKGSFEIDLSNIDD